MKSDFPVDSYGHFREDYLFLALYLTYFGSSDIINAINN